MASTLCLWPIVVALLCADGISKNEKTLWEVSDNAGQHSLANTYKSIADTIQNASLPTDSLPPSFADKVDNFIQNNFHKDASHKEVVVKASQDVAVVNEFMKNNGFPGLQLTPSEDLFSWYIAALLDIKETWAIPGSKDYIHYNNARYQAARFTSSKSQAFDVYEVPNSASSKPITVLSMKTENGDKVFMTLADKPRAGFDLLTHVQQLTPSANAHKTHYDEVYFPYVELDHRCDPAWLIGAFKAKSVEGEEVRITQALQQTRFTMNDYTLINLFTCG